MNALIQGASRGIGLGITKALLDQGHTVIATSRGTANELDKLQKRFENTLVHLNLDVTKEASIENAAGNAYSRVGTLDFLFNVSGLLHNQQQSPERRIEQIDARSMEASFAVNAIGPALMAKHFHSLLSHDRRAVFASMSARVGSIEDNRLGGWYAYRASKAAQNMMTKTLSIELGRRAPNLICVALHPGTVDTELSKPFQRNVPEGKLFEVGRATRQLLEVVDGLTMKDTGTFLDWKGETIPW